MGKIEIIEGDIVDFEGDAVVNAANEALAKGGGVCGAIHHAAGPELEAACREIIQELGFCETGCAAITPGFDLPAKHVIHAVGPIWQGGGNNEEGDLASAYRSALDLAERNGIKTIAFPTLSAGIYGFPLKRAIEIAIEETLAFLEEGDDFIEKVTFVAYGASAYNLYQEVLSGKTNA